MSENVQFEAINTKEIKFGRNNFLEIARKKAVTEEGENHFISISRGFYTQDNQKRFRNSIAFPPEEAENVLNALKEVLETNE